MELEDLREASNLRFLSRSVSVNVGACRITRDRVEMHIPALDRNDSSY